MKMLYESAHVAIALQLLEMSSPQHPTKQFVMFAHGTLFNEFFRKNIGNLTDLHNTKNQSGSFVLIELFGFL